MKKILSLLLALAVLLSSSSFAFADEAQPLPAAGDKTEGFVVKEIRPFDMLGAQMVLYEHEKTGALVLHIANDDLNRLFDIAFRTPTPNNKGIPHVFEHSTLDGSEKYPSKALTFNLIYQTYNTYLNASTYNFMTCYPVASLSEDQLLLYADYYLDSCFHPMLYTDESIFREEAWRYAMTDADAPLTLEGTVYSEMRGASTLNSMSNFNYMGTLFPGSTCANISGGSSDMIPEMTWQELKDYHTQWYHPSNSLTCLYGRFDDLPAFLHLLDSVFSAYEKREYVIEDTGYTPITAPVEKVFDFPAAANADTKNGSNVYYGFVCGNMTDDEFNCLDVFATLFSDNSSVFCQRMKDELPSASVGCFTDFTTPEISLCFVAQGINEEDAPLFKKIVDESLAEVYEKGFDPAAVDAVAASYRLSILTAMESSSVGVDIIPSIQYHWANNKGVFGYSDWVESLDHFTESVENGSAVSAAQSILSGNERYAVVTTRPVPGLMEQQDTALAEKLAGLKAQMTEEEISAIVEYTNREKEEEDASSYVQALTAVTVDTLPEDVRIYPVIDTTDEDGIRYLTAEASLSGVGETALMLDASGLAQDQIHYFKLYCDLLGELNTAEHTRQELASLLTRYLYNGVIRISAMNSEDEDRVHPWLRCTFIALDEDLKPGYDLIREVLFSTQFTDASAIRDLVTSLINSTRQTIISKCYSILLNRAAGFSNGASAYFSYASYLEYYDFLCAILTQLEDDPQTVLDSLSAIQDYFNNRRNAIAGFAGSKESAEKNAAIAKEFLLSLEDRDIAPVIYDFGKVPASEALVVDGTVQYNMIYSSWEEMGLDGYDAGLDAVTGYVTDMILYPQLRDRYGVYSVFHAANEDGMYVITYRDPNLEETYATLLSLADQVAACAPDQETLNGYILSAYPNYSQSEGELSEAFNTLIDYMSGLDPLLRSKYMSQLKAVTPESFARYASIYASLLENSRIGTSGSASKLNGRTDLFEVIHNPFSVADATKVILTDLNESEPFFTEMRWCFENAYVNPLTETTFGVNEPVQLGDLAVSMYIPIGGDNNAEDAIAYLASFGILPQEDKGTLLTRQEMALYLACYCAALGVPVEAGDISAFPDAGDIAPEISGYVGWCVENGLLLPNMDGTLRPNDPATRAEMCNGIYVIFAE